MFWRRDRLRFLKPDRGLRAVFASATIRSSLNQGAPPGGTDSLDLLAAALESKEVERILRNLGIDTGSLLMQVRAPRPAAAEPGLTADAKRIVEAVGHRALQHHEHATSVDLLVALATTPSAARDLLAEVGLDPARLPE